MQTKIIIPVSGGKDSTLCLLLAIERYGKEICVPLFHDTGWEHPETYAYLSRLETRLGIIIQKSQKGKLHGKDCLTMESLIIEARRFPSGKVGRFCSKHLKIEPSERWIRANCTKGDEIWYGMRLKESINRRKRYKNFISEAVYDYDEIFSNSSKFFALNSIKVKLPILELSTSQVFDEIRKRDIEINPLYFEKTNDRVGCYPCFLTSKKTQQKMFNTEFGKIQLAKIRKLEKIIGKKYENIQDKDAPCGFCLI